MTSDPISDMLLRIRNGLKAKLPSITLPGSRIKGEIARVMKEEGYIADFTLTAAVPRALRIELKYNDDAEPAIRGLRRESKPGLRKFCGVQEIPQVLGGMGVAILSTSGGILSGKEARKRKLGGELICTIW
ncbi:MAG TPA: 30S ribosomal protein S8 [Kiritimatiellia bacterium]|jgi:small subunit ribosomal protein S8|nr:30S ribosomal protein S8 [Kiritimatiellia bacterium]HOR97503.1 30S ribosomal protein S8 [Kiritimatiellia bacterium]HPW75362.1 30S ribosomal protein S8 [Kiritimatiellia bacterium]